MTRNARPLDDEGGLAELGETEESFALGAGDGVAAFTLGAERHQAAMPLGGLERIGERAARGMREVIEGFARVRPTVTAQPLETMRFEAWRSALTPPVSLSRYRTGAVKGGLVAMLEGGFVTRLVDAYYGGAGTAPHIRAAELTAGEERVAGRLADALVEILGGAWAQIAPLGATLTGRETAPAQAALVRGDEMVVIQRFAVDAGAVGTAWIDIVYPMASLKALPALGGAGRTGEPTDADRLFRAEFARALTQVTLPVRSVLARPTLSVGELLALKPGDVIPISVGPRVPLLVANRRVAEGTIGEQEGRAALMIEAVETDA